MFTPPHRAFPTIYGISLAKRPFTLPGDLEGQFNLLFITFREDQRPQVETWMPMAAALAEVHPALCYYALPVLRRRRRFNRWRAAIGLRRRVRTPQAQALTIPLYLDTAALRNRLGLQDERHAYVLLVGRDGRVYWRTEGARTNYKAAMLYRLVERLAERFDERPIERPSERPAAPVCAA